MSTAAQLAARAYSAGAACRSPGEQEADVFRRASAALRRADGGTELIRVRALADNERLWTTVIGLLADPTNALPDALRASITSIGLAVQREMRAPAPDYGFLVAVNDSIAAGLSASRP